MGYVHIPIQKKISQKVYQKQPNKCTTSIKSCDVNCFNNENKYEKHKIETNKTNQEEADGDKETKPDDQEDADDDKETKPDDQEVPVSDEDIWYIQLYSNMKKYWYYYSAALVCVVCVLFLFLQKLAIYFLYFNH